MKGISKTNDKIINIEPINIIDWIVKYNSVFKINLEVIFNTDILKMYQNLYQINYRLKTSSISILEESLSTSGLYQNLNTIPYNSTNGSYTESINKTIDNNCFQIEKNFDTAINPGVYNIEYDIMDNNGTNTYTSNTRIIIPNENIIATPTEIKYGNNNIFIKQKGYYFESTDAFSIDIDIENYFYNQFSYYDNESNYNTLRRIIPTDFISEQTAGLTINYANTSGYSYFSSWDITSNNVLGNIIKNTDTTPVIVFNRIECASNLPFNSTNTSYYLNIPLFKGKSGIEIYNIDFSTDMEAEIDSQSYNSSTGTINFTLVYTNINTEPQKITITFNNQVQIQNNFNI